MNKERIESEPEVYHLGRGRVKYLNIEKKTVHITPINMKDYLLDLFAYHLQK